MENGEGEKDELHLVVRFSPLHIWAVVWTGPPVRASQEYRVESEMIAKVR